jgi:hypothetical protein
MTSLRASAYRRVIVMLREIGPATLLPDEQTCIRESADALVFAQDLAVDRDATKAFAAVTVLCDRLIDAERWTPERAQRVLDDIWSCGPAHVPDMLAA